MNTVPGGKYDVAIVGGGITGTAILYVLSNYTDIVRIALLEKRGEPAEINSHYNNNSQTLHFGDIETNYTLEKAKKVKEAAEILSAYMERHAPSSFIKGHKMVLAVGEKESEELERRFEEFKALYPKLKKIGREQIAAIEPKVAAGRNQEEKITALYTEDGYAVNYKKIAQSFIEEARKRGKKIDIFFNSRLKNIKKEEGDYLLATDKGRLRSRVAILAAGPHSLVFAKKLGYGANFGILPVAGNFYLMDKALNGKVYTMQIKKLPFAAVHGDPNVENPLQTRFGPTAKVLPLLERHNYGTFFDFLKTSVWSWGGVASLLKIISDGVIFRYMAKNISYGLPFLGKWLFLKEVRKIIPTAKYGELRFGRGLGGIRPQVVNVREKRMEMGEAEIMGDKIIFNITPSPGASVSLKNAEQTTLKIIEFLKPSFKFDRERWCRDYGSSMQACRE